ncbi:MAG: class I SAM-dependent methyltransferase [Hahellaceae bacterium]|nr:class I SAM-dependent methyltransferase [Hahellaceae bacterium]
MDLKEEGVLEFDIAEHWYYRSKARAMMNMIGATLVDIRSILDIGAGSGYFSKYLLANSLVQEAWCVDISYKSECDAEHKGKPIYFRRSGNDAKAELLLFMDVLEHVDDDVGLLASYLDHVPPGTLILISVPAFQFLWSEHDEFLEHKRRYTLRQIERVAMDAGLTIEKSRYFFGFVFPIAVATRMISKYLVPSKSEVKSQLKQHRPLVNYILTAMCSTELSILRRNKTAGLTAFCLCRKTLP